MKALILNSGIGKRMGALTEQSPKCMTPISDDHTIVSWQLELLKQLGITDIVMTTGPFEDILKDHIVRHGHTVRYVNNPLYSKTNYIYSMELAREWLLGDDVILLHGDLVPEKSVLEDLIRAESSAVAVEDGVALPEKDFKARLRDGRVVEIGIHVFGGDCVASQPAYKLLGRDMEAWMDEIHAFCAGGETGVYAENALNRLFASLSMKPVWLRGRLCNEIDNMDDLAIVSGRFCEYRKERGQ